MLQAEKIAEPSERFSIQNGTRWGERDSLYRIDFEVAIPQDWQGQLLALHLDLSAPPDHSWSINTIEGLVYINDKPFHAVDRYHREIILPPELASQPTLSGYIRVWTGIAEDSHVAHDLELRRLDEAADKLYSLMSLLLNGLENLPENSPNYQAILSGLDSACLRLDFRSGAPSPAFYTSCLAALVVLEEQLKTLVTQNPVDGWQPKISVTGHAHIDVAWLWQLRHTRLKAANTFATAVYHMERYPYFTFTQSQPQLYQYVKEDVPELYALIKEKVAAGQWEAEGAMWVEADTNITSGESVVRQFVYGQRFFREEFGYTCKVLWLPDVFGYSAALPQIIKGAGAEYFITTKISWNEVNRLPVDTFWWQGLDGTRTLAHFITTPPEANQTYYTYNGQLRPSDLLGSWQNYRHKTLNRELLLAYGWGDGGGGPVREMIEAIPALAAPISRDLPTVAPGKVADFMQRLAGQIQDNPQVPIWSGELYLEFHRGTYTSQGRIKRANRHTERNLHNAEWLATLAAEFAELAYPREILDSLWRQTLTLQFHDILPGSSIGPVYSDALETYSQIEQATNQIIEQSQKALLVHINRPAAPTLLVLNSTGWPRPALLEIEANLAQTLGLPFQPLANNRALLKVENIPAFGYRLLSPGAAQPTETNSSAQLIAEPRLLESEFYRIELNQQGQICRLLDKQGYNQTGREVLAVGGRGNVFQLFEDKPVEYDAWNIDVFYEEKSWELDNLVKAEVIEQGPYRAGLSLEWVYQGRTHLRQQIYIYAHTRRIDFVTQVDWQERQTLLKVAFPVAVQSDYATADIQFGNLTRPTHRNTSWEQAKFETCAHKWFDLSEGDYGVAILNDCKYGYDVKANVMRQTLLKGPISPDPTGDLGAHEFTYSLYPHAGNWFAGGVQQEAYALNYPVLAFAQAEPSQSATRQLPPEFSLVQVEPANLVLETVKQAEDSDGVIIRLYECANRRGPFKLKFPFKVSQASEVNLLEENPQPVELTDDGYALTGFITPYQIKTYRLKF